jgi:hypothetical protein
MRKSIQIRDFSFLMELRDCRYATHVKIEEQKYLGFGRPNYYQNKSDSPT